MGQSGLPVPPRELVAHLLLREADLRDLGVDVNHGRHIVDGVVMFARTLSGNILHCHDALVRCSVRQERRPPEVADSVHARDGRLHGLVGFDKPALERNVQAVLPEPLEIRRRAGRDEHRLGRNGHYGRLQEHSHEHAEPAVEDYPPGHGRGNACLELCKPL